MPGALYVKGASEVSQILKSVIEENDHMKRILFLMVCDLFSSLFNIHNFKFLKYVPLNEKEICNLYH